jgi:hypothetical protein
VFVCDDSKQEEILTWNEVVSNAYSLEEPSLLCPELLLYTFRLMAVFLRRFFLLVDLYVCLLGDFTTI